MSQDTWSRGTSIDHMMISQVGGSIIPSQAEYQHVILTREGGGIRGWLIRYVRCSSSRVRI